MRKLQQFGLVAIGAALGVAASLHFSAVADRQVTTLQLPVDDLRLFSEVFGRIKSDYVEPVEDRKLLKEAINGMLTGLDPHSAFLDQEAYRDLQVGTQGEFGGLGIEVGMEDGFVKVISPIEDTPAYRAGIKPNDLIIKLDETPVKGMTLNDAVKRMRGKPNTTITLTISRKGESAPVIVTRAWPVHDRAARRDDDHGPPDREHRRLHVAGDPRGPVVARPAVRAAARPG